MVRGTNPVKRQEWVERFKRYRRSGLTVAAFCRQEQVAAPTFYQWKRRLANAAGVRSAEGKQQPATKWENHAFQPVRVTNPSGNSLGVTIRLPEGIVIGLGTDLAMVEKVVGLVLDRQMGSV